MEPKIRTHWLDDRSQMSWVQSIRPRRTLLHLIAWWLPVFAFTVPAEATSLIHNGDDFEVQIIPLGNRGVSRLKAVQLTIVGKNGALPNGFDSTKGGFPGPFPGITTVGNNLHQIWEFDGVVMTPTLDLAGDPMPVPQEMESYFLVDASPTGDVHPFNPPLEDIVLGSIEDPRGGFGNFLRGTFFLKGGLETTKWDLAQLVVRENTELLFDFELTASGGQLEEIVNSFKILLGDLDFDGGVDFDDIDFFVMGLSDPAEYFDLFGVNPAMLGDIDADGDLDFDDIPGFVDVLSVPVGSQSVPVPEPMTMILLIVGTWLAGQFRFGYRY